MKKIILNNLLAAVVFATAASAAQAQSTWKIDPAHSQSEFTVRHMAISNVRGRFTNINGIIIFDEKDLAKSSVNATVDTTTVDTGVAQRDGHLKSPDFFEVAKFPTMSFVSRSVAKSGDDYIVNGDLTLHGITKPVVLRLDDPGKEQLGPDNKPHRGFSATTTIHRQDFGLVWNGTLKSGDNVLGDDVKITLDIEAAQE
ncbi:polyisoprenoid-binding protein YceI [Silvibacterium bohemicum]|uniref:Polyisoprenoid-binding protein YceI n=1 Tax=Silvibacterium bohemicum TaxID=1577686 RepID=A0A841JU97_9BACT|nr:YceI family protein [Silvibacterium bohemicum]MBB6142561.1 polyisoprenoid-binding protein YceI [Silvibacterium bohemicum]